MEADAQGLIIIRVNGDVFYQEEQRDILHIARKRGRNSMCSTSYDAALRSSYEPASHY